MIGSVWFFVLAAIAVLVGGTAYLCTRVRKRRASGRTRKPGKRTSPLVMAAFLGMLACGMFVVLPDIMEMLAKDKIIAANNAAHKVYCDARDFAETADASDCVTVIGQFGDTDTPLAAYLHEQAYSEQMTYYYAVVFRNGKVRFAMVSGNPLSLSELHKPNFETQIREVKWQLGSSYDDVIGYYEGT